jgi:hypothetical protein
MQQRVGILGTVLQANSKTYLPKGKEKAAVVSHRAKEDAQLLIGIDHLNESIWRAIELLTSTFSSRWCEISPVASRRTFLAPELPFRPIVF